jgi:uncharacterized repeat protein (TIGR03803 family)
MSSRLGFENAIVRLNCLFKLVSLAGLIAFELAFGLVAQAQNSPVTVLFSFFAEHTSKQPISMIKARNGRYYGTTIGGEGDLGSIFSISTDGTFATLYFFQDRSTGDTPYGQLVEGTDGNFYGTTVYGGLTYQGVAFRITPEGALTVLHTFGSDPTDGTNPYSGLIQGRDGNFYGTTHAGGANGVGTVFRMTPEGKVTILHNFALNQSPTGGARPNAQTLTRGRDGLLYGITQLNVDSAGDYGTAFRISADGKFKVMYRFPAPSSSDSTSGYGPVAPLIEARDGSFYGTTQFGGGLNAAGTVFRMTPGGRVTFLHSFLQAPKGGCGKVCEPGSFPTNPLVEANDGFFYSTISSCKGGQDCVYKIGRSGEFSDIYDFTSQEAMSAGRLIPGDDGLYYSFAQGGGLIEHRRDGDVFSIKFSSEE